MKSFLTLAEAWQRLGDRKEFAVRRYDGLVCLNYVVQLPDSFEQGRESFRGITFDESSGEVVSLPFHKFFNVNQTEETQFHRIQHLSATIYEKCDGSMIHCFEWQGEIRTATRMGYQSDVAKSARRFLDRQPELRERVAESLRQGLTPLFEFTSPDFQVVLQHRQPALVYLHSRDRATGQYVYEADYPLRAARYDFPFAEIVERVQPLRDFEGFVCQLENGLWVKAKSNWYREQHSVANLFQGPAYKLYRACLDDGSHTWQQGIMDDLLGQAPEHLREAMRNLDRDVQNTLLQRVQRAQEQFAELTATLPPQELPADRRKQFALAAQKLGKDEFSVQMLLYQDRDIAPLIRKHLFDVYREQYTRPLLAYLDEG